MERIPRATYHFFLFEPVLPCTKEDSPKSAEVFDLGVKSTFVRVRVKPPHEERAGKGEIQEQGRFGSS